MGQSVQSGVQSITGSVTASVSPIPTLMLSTKHASIAAPGSTAIGTVPANKEWYIVAVSVAVATSNAASARTGYAQVLANAVNILSVPLETSASAGAGGVSNAAELTAPMGCYVGAALTAGQVVNLNASGSFNNSCGTIWYYEKSV